VSYYTTNIHSICNCNMVKLPHNVGEILRNFSVLENSRLVNSGHSALLCVFSFIIWSVFITLYPAELHDMLILVVSAKDSVEHWCKHLLLGCGAKVYLWIVVFKYCVNNTVHTVAFTHCVSVVKNRFSIGILMLSIVVLEILACPFWWPHCYFFLPVTVTFIWVHFLSACSGWKLCFS